jgi:uncharacterized membrane protein
MLNLIDYINIFIFFGILGWSWEKILRPNKYICDAGFTKYGICIPLSIPYGFGGIILFLLKKYYNRKNIFMFAIIAGIILSILECISGKNSYHIDKIKVWDYYNGTKINDMCTFCDGYVSLKVMLVWTIAAGIFYKITDHAFFKELVN